MKMVILYTVVIAAIIMSVSSAYNNNNFSRRGFLNKAVTSASSSLLLPLTTIANAATAEDGVDKLTDVYFGVGCFWHIQHEFVEAERKLLKRTDKELTSRTGYAGGTKLEEGKVCYHNFQSIADYGRLGHGEVVGMTVPESKIGDFAEEYNCLRLKKNSRLRRYYLLYLHTYIYV